AACAHFSSIGNIAKAVPDLWSNESVNNVHLLGGMAPTVSMEQLIYATRLMNTATRQGPQSTRLLRNLFVESDARLDPQAYVLQPEVVLNLSRKIIEERTPYLRTRKSALAVLELLRNAAKTGELTFSRMESRWLDKLSMQADQIPEDENELFQQLLPTIDSSKVNLSEYGF
ncbi:MAG TPA: methyltransferase MtaB domain-containing protein, partial [Anaerolineaceae bacterium]|nr:methyltransferase MtaB domain-containing protein [Anaerolineaceae bacterium]